MNKLLTGLLCLLLLQLTFQPASAVVYYSRTSGGNWNDNTSWSTTGYGQSTNTGTFPKSGDVAYIGDTYTIVINVSCTTSTLIIGDGGSGILEYSSAGNYGLVVISNLTINNGASLRYNGNATRTHTLHVGGNISNSGTMDLYADANDLVNLLFYRPANSIVTGNGTFDLNTVTVNKSTSSSFSVDVQSTTFESGIRELVLTYGTYHHNNSSTYSVNSSGSAFSIPADGVIRVSQGTLHLSPNQSEVTLSGTITLSGGTLLIGASSGTGGLRYDKLTSFNPRLDIQSGSMEVYGSLTFKTGAGSDPLNFTMTGGSLLLHSGSTGNSEPVFRINDVSGSVFSITDGHIILQAPNLAGTTTSDFSICGTNGSVTSAGGTIQFGNNLTAANAVFTFTPQGSISFPNLRVSGPSSLAGTLCPVAGNTADIRCISLSIEDQKTFDIRSADGASGVNRTMTITGNSDGIHALLNDGNYFARTSTLSLEGGEGQELGGNGTFNLYNLDMSSSGGSTLGQNISIEGQLNLNSGIIYSGPGHLLTLKSGAVCVGASESSYIDGQLAVEVASVAIQNISLPVGKDGAYRPVTFQVQHSTASNVVYTAEILNSNPRDLGYTIPSGIDRISGVRYLSLQRSGAANFNTATITLSYGADDGVDDPSNLRLMRYNGSGAWISINGEGSAPVAGSITSSSFNSFGTLFTFGNNGGGTNPLPVDWLYVIVKSGNNGNTISWSTGSEKESDFFEVQRSSDGIYYDVLGRIDAAGNSTDQRTYQWLDRKTIPGISYYRIRQVDLNGSYSYSAVRVVSTDKDWANVFPNPLPNRQVNVEWSPLESGIFEYRLISAAGNIIYAGSSSENGQVQVLDLPLNTNPGNYFLHLTASSGEELIRKIRLE